MGASLPGFDNELASLVVAARAQVDGFSSLEDLGSVLDLPRTNLSVRATMPQSCHDHSAGGRYSERSRRNRTPDRGLDQQGTPDFEHPPQRLRA
jgi:hypothetical protein